MKILISNIFLIQYNGGGYIKFEKKNTTSEIFLSPIHYFNKK